MSKIPDPKLDARNRLAGRVMVIGMLLLVAVYAAVTFWPH